MIGIVEKSGQVMAVCCHNGMSLYANGIILYERYKDIEQVRDLLSQADITSLNPDITIPTTGFNPHGSAISVFHANSNRHYESLAHAFNKLGKDEPSYLFHERKSRWYFWNYHQEKLMPLESALLGATHLSAQYKESILQKRHARKLHGHLSKTLPDKNLPRTSHKL